MVKLSKPWLLTASILAATIPQINANHKIEVGFKPVQKYCIHKAATKVLTRKTAKEPCRLLVALTPNKVGTVYLFFPHLVPIGSPTASPQPPTK